MHKEPMVYVVVLNWNGWHDTLKCLESLSKLSYRNYHVLVIDNGSTDDSVLQIRRKFPDVALIETQENLGFGGGCNIGIQKAIEECADYIWILNNDTIVANGALKEMVSVAESDQNIGAVGSVIINMQSPSQILAWGGGYISFMRGKIVNYKADPYKRKLEFLNGASLLLKASALKTVGLFDSKKYFLYIEETDLTLRMVNYGYKIACADRSIVQHQESASLGMDSPLKYYYYSKSLVIFFSTYAVFPLWPILISLFRRLIVLSLRRKFSIMRGVIKGYADALSYVVAMNGVSALLGWRRRMSHQT